MGRSPVAFPHLAPSLPHPLCYKVISLLMEIRDLTNEFPFLKKKKNGPCLACEYQNFFSFQPQENDLKSFYHHLTIESANLMGLPMSQGSERAFCDEVTFQQRPEGGKTVRRTKEGRERARARRGAPHAPGPAAGAPVSKRSQKAGPAATQGQSSGGGDRRVSSSRAVSCRTSPCPGMTSEALLHGMEGWRM